MAALLGGIVNDAQQLIRQEVALARREVQEELDKAKTAAVSLTTALVAAIPGALMFCFFVAELLHWLTAPKGYDAAGIPLWGCYLIVSAALLGVSVLLCYVAKSKLSGIKLVPPQTAESLKENVQWIKNQT
jgi:VIT1/CCC1 family predicted Fe2+/Mn2+ transporter